MIKFLHTADTHLGYVPSYMSDNAKSNFHRDRIKSLEKMATIAKASDCKFVIIAGDFFHNNQVGVDTIISAAEVLNKFRPLTVYLMPANHDPLEAGSPYKRDKFLDRIGEHVILINDEQPHTEFANLEIIGAPWYAKDHGYDPLTKLLDALPSVSNDRIRIVIGHGNLDIYGGGEKSDIKQKTLSDAAAARKFHYLALGDRHSVTEVVSPNCWYSGAPEATAYDEIDSGKALVVTLDSVSTSVVPFEIGTWKFVKMEVDLTLDDTAGRVGDVLKKIDNKMETLVDLTLKGVISFKESLHLEEILSTEKQAFASLRIRSTNELKTIHGEHDVSQLELSGMSKSLWTEVQCLVDNGDENAKYALMKLYSMLQGGSR